MIDFKKEWGEACVATYLVDREALFLDARSVAAVGLLESGCGAGWKGPGIGSNNKGCIQSTRAWRAAGGREFSYTDTHPVDQDDGQVSKSIPYQIGFRVYDTSLDGWVDLARLLHEMRVTGEGSPSQSPVRDAVSRRMRAAGYYEGFGNNQEERIANHAKAFWRAINTFAKSGVTAGIYDSAPLSSFVELPTYVIPEPILRAPYADIAEESIAGVLEYVREGFRENRPTFD